MNRKTVENFSQEEFENAGVTGAIKSEKGRRSVILPLILSILAAIAIWMYVIASNNTCSAVPVQVNGNEQLMSSNYSVSSVEPAFVDVVLRGKQDVVSQIISDKSMITASIDIFGKAGDGESVENRYLFASPEEIKEGEYTVDVQFSLPNGVTCSTKAVKVTIAKSYSRTFTKDDFNISFKNYTISEEFIVDYDNITVADKELTVSGDEATVSSIERIGLNSDWNTEITGDKEAKVTPVAYDNFGEIDSTYLHFEPEFLFVNIPANKVKTFSLVLKTPENDTGEYTLSVDTVRLVGPMPIIDSIDSEIVLNDEQDFESDPKIHDRYELVAGRFGARVAIDRGGENYASSLEVNVERTERMRSAILSIPDTAWKVIPPEGYKYVIAASRLMVNVEYLPLNGEEIKADDLLVLIELSAESTGIKTVRPTVTVLDAERFGYVRITARDLLVRYEEIKSDTQDDTKTTDENGNG